MVNLESLLVKIVGDASGLDAVIGKTDGMLASVGKGMQTAGTWMTTAVTLPIIGVGVAAVNASTELNGMMGNVQSLGIGTERVIDLKSSVQDLAVEMGKGTDDMADGLYQVISAFGDTSSTVDILENAARTGAAGLATTTDALNLLATVTKGYGDESLEAQKKVSDLAFQTVNLGQTTFPELASSMGKVVPLAAALGVSQEELFAQMATLTGVTGTAAEVTTQLRATYQGILSPTKEMADSMIRVTSELDRQGKLAAGPFTDAWHKSLENYQNAATKSRTLKDQLVALEQQMANSGDGAKGLNEQLKAHRLETEKSVIALKEQLSVTDTSTDAGKAQAQAIEEQIKQLKLLSDRREVEIQEQILAASSSQSLADQYRALKTESKNAEKAAEDAGKTLQSTAAGMGTTIVESVGLTDAMKMLSDTAGGNTDTLSKMFGSVEALNAVLALSGGQAESFEKKLAAMGDASGATDKAFEAQTQGVNATGFAMQQVWSKVEVLTQKLGDGLGPTLMRLIDDPITPLIDKLIETVNWFANTDSETQSWIVTIAAVAAAVGPALVIIGTLISAVSSIVGVFSAASGAVTVIGGVIAALGGPITLIVAAIGGLAYAWYENWWGIRDFTDSIFGEINFSFQGLKDGMASTWEGIKAVSQLGWDDYKNMANASLSAVESSLGLSQGTIKQTFLDTWTAIKNAVMEVDWLGLGTAIIRSIIDGITITASALAETAQNVASGFWDSLKSFMGLDSGTSLSGGTPGGVGGGGVPTPSFAGGGAMYNINVTVYVGGVGDSTSDANNGARSGVLEALRSVGLA